MSEKILVSFEVDNSGAIRQVKKFRGEVEGVPRSTAKASAGLAKLKNALALASAHITHCAISIFPL